MSQSYQRPDDYWIRRNTATQLYADPLATPDKWLVNQYLEQGYFDVPVPQVQEKEKSFWEKVSEFLGLSPDEETVKSNMLKLQEGMQNASSAPVGYTDFIYGDAKSLTPEKVGAGLGSGSLILEGRDIFRVRNRDGKMQPDVLPIATLTDEGEILPYKYWNVDKKRFEKINQEITREYLAAERKAARGAGVISEALSGLGEAFVQPIAYVQDVFGGGKHIAVPESKYRSGTTEDVMYGQARTGGNIMGEILKAVGTGGVTSGAAALTGRVVGPWGLGTAITAVQDLPRTISEIATGEISPQAGVLRTAVNTLGNVYGIKAGTQAASGIRTALSEGKKLEALKHFGVGLGKQLGYGTVPAAVESGIDYLHSKPLDEKLGIETETQFVKDLITNVGTTAAVVIASEILGFGMAGLKDRIKNKPKLPKLKVADETTSRINEEVEKNAPHVKNMHDVESAVWKAKKEGVVADEIAERAYRAKLKAALSDPISAENAIYDMMGKGATVDDVISHLERHDLGVLAGEKGLVRAKIEAMYEMTKAAKSEYGDNIKIQLEVDADGNVVTKYVNISEISPSVKPVEDVVAKVAPSLDLPSVKVSDINKITEAEARAVNRVLYSIFRSAEFRGFRQYLSSMLKDGDLNAAPMENARTIYDLYTEITGQSPVGSDVKDVVSLVANYSVGRVRPFYFESNFGRNIDAAAVDQYPPAKVKWLSSIDKKVAIRDLIDDLRKKAGLSQDEITSIVKEVFDIKTKALSMKDADIEKLIISATERKNMTSDDIAKKLIAAYQQAGLESPPRYLRVKNELSVTKTASETYQPSVSKGTPESMYLKGYEGNPTEANPDVALYYDGDKYVPVLVIRKVPEGYIAQIEDADGRYIEKVLPASKLYIEPETTAALAVKDVSQTLPQPEPTPLQTEQLPLQKATEPEAPLQRASNKETPESMHLRGYEGNPTEANPDAALYYDGDKYVPVLVIRKVGNDYVSLVEDINGNYTKSVLPRERLYEIPEASKDVDYNNMLQNAAVADKAAKSAVKGEDVAITREQSADVGAGESIDKNRYNEEGRSGNDEAIIKSDEAALQRDLGSENKETNIIELAKQSDETPQVEASMPLAVAAKEAIEALPGRAGDAESQVEFRPVEHREETSPPDNVVQTEAKLPATEAQHGSQRSPAAETENALPEVRPTDATGKKELFDESMAKKIEAKRAKKTKGKKVVAESEATEKVLQAEVKAEEKTKEADEVKETEISQPYRNSERSDVAAKKAVKGEPPVETIARDVGETEKVATAEIAKETDVDDVYVKYGDDDSSVLPEPYEKVEEVETVEPIKQLDAITKEIDKEIENISKPIKETEESGKVVDPVEDLKARIEEISNEIKSMITKASKAEIDAKYAERAKLQKQLAKMQGDTEKKKAKKIKIIEQEITRKIKKYSDIAKEEKTKEAQEKEAVKSRDTKGSKKKDYKELQAIAIRKIYNNGFGKDIEGMVIGKQGDKYYYQIDSDKVEIDVLKANKDLLGINDDEIRALTGEKRVKGIKRTATESIAQDVPTGMGEVKKDAISGALGGMILIGEAAAEEDDDDSIVAKVKPLAAGLGFVLVGSRALRKVKSNITGRIGSVMPRVKLPRFFIDEGRFASSKTLERYKAEYLAGLPDEKSRQEALQLYEDYNQQAKLLSASTWRWSRGLLHVEGKLAKQVQKAVMRGEERGHFAAAEVQSHLDTFEKKVGEAAAASGISKDVYKERLISAADDLYTEASYIWSDRSIDDQSKKMLIEEMNTPEYILGRLAEHELPQNKATLEAYEAFRDINQVAARHEIGAILKAKHQIDYSQRDALMSDYENTIRENVVKIKLIKDKIAQRTAEIKMQGEYKSLMSKKGKTPEQIKKDMETAKNMIASDEKISSYKEKIDYILATSKVVKNKIKAIKYADKFIDNSRSLHHIPDRWYAAKKDKLYAFSAYEIDPASLERVHQNHAKFPAEMRYFKTAEERTKYVNNWLSTHDAKPVEGYPNVWEIDIGGLRVKVKVNDKINLPDLQSRTFNGMEKVRQTILRIARDDADYKIEKAKLLTDLKDIKAQLEAARDSDVELSADDADTYTVLDDFIKILEKSKSKDVNSSVVRDLLAYVVEPKAKEFYPNRNVKGYKTGDISWTQLYNDGIANVVLRTEQKYSYAYLRDAIEDQLVTAKQLGISNDYTEWLHDIYSDIAFSPASKDYLKSILPGKANDIVMKLEKVLVTGALGVNISSAAKNKIGGFLATVSGLIADGKLTGISGLFKSLRGELDALRGVAETNAYGKDNILNIVHKEIIRRGLIEQTTIHAVEDPRLGAKMSKFQTKLLYLMKLTEMSNRYETAIAFADAYIKQNPIRPGMSRRDYVNNIVDEAAIFVGRTQGLFKINVRTPVEKLYLRNVPLGRLAVTLLGPQINFMAFSANMFRQALKSASFPEKKAWAGLLSLVAAGWLLGGIKFVPFLEDANDIIEVMSGKSDINLIEKGEKAIVNLLVDMGYSNDQIDFVRKIYHKGIFSAITNSNLSMNSSVQDLFVPFLVSSMHKAITKELPEAISEQDAEKLIGVVTNRFIALQRVINAAKQFGEGEYLDKSGNTLNRKFGVFDFVVRGALGPSLDDYLANEQRYVDRKDMDTPQEMRAFVEKIFEDGVGIKTSKRNMRFVEELKEDKKLVEDARKYSNEVSKILDRPSISALKERQEKLLEKYIKSNKDKIVKKMTDGEEYYGTNDKAANLEKRFMDALDRYYDALARKEIAERILKERGIRAKVFLRYDEMRAKSDESGLRRGQKLKTVPPSERAYWYAILSVYNRLEE